MDKWINSFSNKLGQLAQRRMKKGVGETKTLQFIIYSEIPSNRKGQITNAQMVCDCHTNENRPPQFRLILEGSRI